MPDPEQESRTSRGSALIAAALVASALIVSFGMSSAAPRYQLVASGGGVVRMDNDSGEMIACNLRGCARVQPPDRARTLRSIRSLVGGSSPPADRKQLPAPRP